MEEAQPNLIPAEEPGGMTWQEVKDFLDHIRTTCMDERQALKLEVRRLRAELQRRTTVPEGWLECAAFPKDKYFVVEGSEEWHLYEEDEYGAFT